MKRRLRKKYRRGEFAEKSFDFSFDYVGALSEDEKMHVGYLVLTAANRVCGERTQSTVGGHINGRQHGCVSALRGEALNDGHRSAFLAALMQLSSIDNAEVDSFQASWLAHRHFRFGPRAPVGNLHPRGRR